MIQSLKLNPLAISFTPKETSAGEAGLKSTPEKIICGSAGLISSYRDVNKENFGYNSSNITDIFSNKNDTCNINMSRMHSNNIGCSINNNSLNCFNLNSEHISDIHAKEISCINTCTSMMDFLNPGTNSITGSSLNNFSFLSTGVTTTLSTTSSGSSTCSSNKIPFHSTAIGPISSESGSTIGNNFSGMGSVIDEGHCSKYNCGGYNVASSVYGGSNSMSEADICTRESSRRESIGPRHRGAAHYLGVIASNYRFKSVKFYTPNPIGSSGMIAYVNDRFCVVTRRDAQLLELLAVQKPLPKRYRNACQYCYKRSSKACWHKFTDNLRRIICPLVGYKLAVLQSYRKKNPSYQVMRSFHRKVSLKALEKLNSVSDKDSDYCIPAEQSLELPYKHSPNESTDSAIWGELCSQNYEAEFHKKLQASEVVYNSKSTCEVLAYMPVSERIASRSQTPVSSQLPQNPKICSSDDTFTFYPPQTENQQRDSAENQSCTSEDKCDLETYSNEMIQKMDEVVDCIVWSDESSLSQNNMSSGSGQSTSVQISKSADIDGLDHNGTSVSVTNHTLSQYSSECSNPSFELKTLNLPPLCLGKPLTSGLMKLALNNLSDKTNFSSIFLKCFEKTIINTMAHKIEKELQTDNYSMCLELFAQLFKKRSAEFLNFVRCRGILDVSHKNIVCVLFKVIKPHANQLNLQTYNFRRIHYWNDLERLIDATLSGESKKLSDEITKQVEQEILGESYSQTDIEGKFMRSNFVEIMDMTNESREKLTYSIVRMCEKISMLYSRLAKIKRGEANGIPSHLREIDIKENLEKINNIQNLFGELEVESSCEYGGETESDAAIDEMSSETVVELKKNITVKGSMHPHEAKLKDLAEKYTEKTAHFNSAKAFAIRYALESLLKKVKLLDYFLNNADVIMQLYDPVSALNSKMDEREYKLCDVSLLLQEIEEKVCEPKEHMEGNPWQQPNLAFIAAANNIWTKPNASDGTYNMWG